MSISSEGSRRNATLRVKKTGLAVFGVDSAPLVGLLICGMLVSQPAWAAETPTADHSLAIFIAQVVLLLTVGRLLGEAMERIGQPAVMGQLLAGILLGPSLFGLLAPSLHTLVFPDSIVQKKMLDAVAQLGILMLLLLTGMETDLSIVRKVRRAAAAVSVSGIVIPFALGVALGEFMPASLLPDPEKRLITSLFLGTALSIASVKIVATVVREMNFMRRNVGQVIIAAAIIDDTIGWIIVAIIFGIAIHGEVDALAVAQSVIGTLLFLVFSFTVGRRIVHFLIRWTNDTLRIEFAAVTTILVIMGVMALITDWIGVHTVLGAFVAGMLVGQSPILTRHIDQQLRGLITALFMPVFFAVAGLNADLTILRTPAVAWLTLGLILVASVGKFSGAFIGSRLGGMSSGEGLALAFGMNARGSTEVIVASIGLAIGALTRDLYTMIVAMAIVTTMAMPPSLRWALKRLPLSNEEKERLERDAAEQSGFVPKLERVLMVVDESSHGRLAAGLGGLLSGSRRLATTVLPIRNPTPNDAEPSGRQATDWAALVGRDATEFNGSMEEDNTQTEKKWTIEVAQANDDIPVDEAVIEKAKQGHDFLLLGIESMINDKDGSFSVNANQIAAGFNATLAFVAARGKHLVAPFVRSLDILIPVSGTTYSRNGAEVALAIARAANVRPTVLYISGATPRRSWMQRFGQIELTSQEQSMMRDLTKLAAQYRVSINITSTFHRDPQ
ncbi:MAG: Kef-type K+ transport system membrane component KefB, partial [Hyphomicrobiaceae bacterium]